MGSGGFIVAAALFGHLAVPLAVAGLVLGGGTLFTGLAFHRPLRAVRFSNKDFSAEVDEAEESASIAKDAEALSRSWLSLLRSWCATSGVSRLYRGERRRRGDSAGRGFRAKLSGGSN